MFGSKWKTVFPYLLWRVWLNSIRRCTRLCHSRCASCGNTSPCSCVKIFRSPVRYRQSSRESVISTLFGSNCAQPDSVRAVGLTRSLISHISWQIRPIAVLYRCCRASLSVRKRRSMSEWGNSAPRPYPPRATRQNRSGVPSSETTNSSQSRRAISSTRADRRAKAASPSPLRSKA